MYRYALALLGVFFCMPAFAETKLEVSVAVVSTQVNTLKVGDMANLTVTVTNKGDKAAENLKVLEFDRQSIFLRVAYKGSKKTFTDVQVHDAYNRPKKFDRFKLDPKKSQSYNVLVPCLLAEDLTVTAVYAGAGNEIQSKPVVLKISPIGKKGLVREARVRVYTNRGSFEIKFFPKVATGTCNNFVRLVHKNFYNGLIFHRIIKDFMIQGGCPRGTGIGGPGYHIPAEISGKRHIPGRVAMAHAKSIDSGGSQFYICTGEAQHLNKIHSVFGEIVKGMDVVNVHGATKTARPSKPVTPQRIRRMVLVP